MDPNVCPVCTLYLREGITLHNHLNTHPKDQVIEALVRCASVGVPSSVRNETNESVQDPVSAAQPSIDSPATSVHHFASPVQTLPAVPSSGPVSLSSPFGIAGSISLPNTIPSQNTISNPSQGPNSMPSLQPFAIGLGSAGNQYASTFAYQQFCGGGDGTFGGGPLLLTMSPQQQYAAYSSSSSSSSSNSVLQMVFNPYAVDQVIGSQSYPASGLIAGIGIGPTLQTCQQVQTNVLQQVVTASPIVATPIPSVPAEDKADRGANEDGHQLHSPHEEIITDEVQFDEIPRGRVGNLDVSHPVHNLGTGQNTSPSSSSQLVVKTISAPLEVGALHQRVNRRGRTRTKSTTKSPNSKRQNSQSSTNRNLTVNLPMLDLNTQGSDKEGPKRAIGKIHSPKHFGILEHVNAVYEGNDEVIVLEENSNHPEKSVYEKLKKQYVSKPHEEIIEIDSCLEATPNGDTTKSVVHSPLNEDVRDEAKDRDDWVDFSLFPQSGSPAPTDAVPSAIQEEDNDDADDHHFQEDVCFENEGSEQSKVDALSSCNGQNDEEMRIIVINQWHADEEKDNSGEMPADVDIVENNAEGEEVIRKKDDAEEDVDEGFLGREKDYENEQPDKSECWVQTTDDIILEEEVQSKDQRFERQSLATNEDVLAVNQGENATMEPEQECRPCGLADGSRQNLQECRPTAQGDGCLEGNLAIHSGGSNVHPAPGDTEDALPAPPSPVNIFQIDGMNIILSSRLIEQTDKMRERLGIFEGLGPMAGTYGDISIPEGILEEGLVVSDIIANEAMPPRGELSGQEGVGSGSNCSNASPVDDPVPKTEGSTVWTSGGFSLFPASARQGGTQCDLLPSGEAWSPIEGYKARQEPSIPSAIPETVPKRKPRAKRSTTAAGGASKVASDPVTKTKTKRLYNCWTCLEVFNCPKERRVHQREKHGGEKTLSVAPPTDSSVMPPTQVDGQQQSLASAAEVSGSLVKSEVKEAKVEPRDPAEVEVKEPKVSTEIKEDTKELNTVEDTKLTHACSDCERSFPSLRSLTAHRRAAHRDSRFKCVTCSEKFLTSADFTNHVRTVHPLECSMCGKQFCRQQNLRLHLKRHLSVRPYKCTQCDKAFVTNQKMEEHLNSHTGRTPFQCPLCPRAFRRHSNLIQHRKHHHLKVKRKVRDFFCHCGAVFHSVKKLEWHKETHEDKPKTCPHCSDRFVHKAGLTRHIRQAHDRRYVPSGAREDVNVECPVCSAVYLKSSLHIHMRVHSGERPFSCGICGKGFATKWNLQLHRWVHASPHSKPFKCVTCKAAYHRRVDFIAHVRSHRKVRPYVCNTCGRRFMRKYNCVRHSREHDAGKAFECTICQKRFHRRYYLKEHLRIHTGLRPYVCHVCGKASGTKSNMNKHVRIHHAREPVNTEG